MENVLNLAFYCGICTILYYYLHHENTVKINTNKKRVTKVKFAPATLCLGLIPVTLFVLLDHSTTFCPCMKIGISSVIDIALHTAGLLYVCRSILKPNWWPFIIHVRFMATNDLMMELQKDSIKLDEDSEKKVVAMLLKLLEDKNGEVQNLAVKWWEKTVPLTCRDHLVENVWNICIHPPDYLWFICLWSNLPRQKHKQYGI